MANLKRDESFMTCPHAVSLVFPDEFPELSKKDEDDLNNLIQNIHKDDEDDGEENGSPAEEEGGDENDQLFDDATMELLMESATVQDESHFNILDIPLMANVLNNAARAPAKRKPIPNLATASSRKKTRSSGNEVTIVNRIIPDKAPNDRNEYRVIILSNGLRAALVRRPAADIAGGNGNREFREFMDSLSTAKKVEKKLRREKCLPSNFPLGNKPLAQVLSKIVKKELERIGTSRRKKTGSNNNDENDRVIDLEMVSLPMNKNGAYEKLESTCAVAVNVGTCDDPLNCLGLAHFLEHMVHYGSEKYAGEDEYWSFAFNNSYEFNAFTENHSTCYYQSLPITCLDKGMSMMLGMLSKPLFRNEMTCREVNAVDSEFHLSRHIEFLRRRFLFQHALGDHPLAKFDCGTVETLLEPRSIHKTLRAFHDKYYVASAMTACLESPLPFAVQEKLILKHFSDLPEGPRKTYRETPLKPSEELVTDASFNMDYVMQGICSISNLWLAWPIPEAFVRSAANKSLAVLLKVLSEEWEGGLAHYLTNEEYIWSMFCSKSHIYSDPSVTENKYSTFVTIDFFLTRKGEAHVQEIMQATYSFLRELVKTPDSKFLQVFHELKLEGERNYNINGARSTSSVAINLAKELQREESQNILKDDSWLWKDANYVPQEIRKILGHLKSSNMIVIQTLPKTIKLREYTTARKVEVERYGEAEYVVQGLGKRFGNLDGKKRTAKNYEWPILEDNVNAQALTVPPPEHYGVIGRQEVELDQAWGAKVLAAVHFGNVIGNYESVCLVMYEHPEVASNARSFATALLWSTSVYLSFSHGMKDHSSDTEFLVSVNDYGIMIGVIGHAEKLHDQIAALNQEFFTTPVTELDLKMAQAALSTLYDMFVAPSQDFITSEVLHFVTCDHAGDMLSDAMLYVKDVSVNEVNAYSLAFKSISVGLVIFAGNLSIPMAKDIVNTINRQDQDYASNFPTVRWTVAEYFKSESHFPRECSMTPGERCVRIKSDHCYTFTTTVTNFYYLGTYEPSKYLLLANSLLYFQMRAFIELRMKKQLGYHIQGYFPRPSRGQSMVIGVGVVSTAANFTQCELDKHLDQFMVDYGKFLETVDETEFRCIKKRRGFDGFVTRVKMANARKVYQEHFGDMFASDNQFKFHHAGVSKICVQVLGNGSKACDCANCQQIVGWKRGEIWNHFQFAQERPSDSPYFIDDPKKLGCF